jgi:hypothetical protein
MAKEGGAGGAPSAPMAKEGEAGERLPGQKRGRDGPLWPSQTYGVPTWPKKGRGAPPSLAIPWGAYMAKEREVGEPIGPFGPPLREGTAPLAKGGEAGGALRPLWPSPTGGDGPFGQRRGGRGSPSAPLAIPHLRAAGAYMAIPSGWGGPYGQKRDGPPFGQTPPFGPDGHPLRAAPFGPLWLKRVMAIPMGKEHLAIPSLRPMGEWLPLAIGAKEGRRGAPLTL